MKRVLILATAVAAGALLLSGCPSPVTSDNGLRVGDRLANGFVVSYVDPGGGYMASREDIELPDYGNPVQDGGIEDQTLVTGRFIRNLRWTADRVYYLDSTVFIGNDTPAGSATLTIEPGTLIKGINGISPGLLVITRYSKIEAVGTAEAPIVFTSNLVPGERRPGDWGGIVINGRAPTNEGTAADGSYLQDVYGEGASGPYGGNVENDNSGTLKYVRVEFAGRIFTADNELNGIAFQGVGSGTTVDYVQVHMSKDDGVEFFGGTVQAKHLVITGTADDGLDWTSGWRGSAQWVFIQQYPSNLVDSKCIEGDNLQGNNNKLPRSFPILANVTAIGNNNSNTTQGVAHFRRGTYAHMYNSLLMNSAAADEITVGEPASTTVNFWGCEADVSAILAALPAGQGNVSSNGIMSWVPTGAAPQNSGTPGQINQYDDFWGVPPTTKNNIIMGVLGFTATPRPIPAVDQIGNQLDAAGSTVVGCFDGINNWASGWTTNLAY